MNNVMSKRVNSFCDALILAAEEHRGLRWPRFVSHNDTATELRSRGWRLTQDYPGEWFAESLRTSETSL